MTARDVVILNPVTPNLKAQRFHLVGDDTPSGGAGGWEAVSRPRRKAAAEWGGTELWSLVLPLLVTGVESSRGHDSSVEGDVRALLAIARKHPKTGQPPILTVSGPVRVPSPRMRWVIQGFEWGDQIRNTAGRRVQQYVTVTLLEYEEAAVLLSPAKAAKSRNAGKGKKATKANLASLSRK